MQATTEQRDEQAFFIPRIFEDETGGIKVESQSNPGLFHTVRRMDGGYVVTQYGVTRTACATIDWARRWDETREAWERMNEPVKPTDDDDPEPPCDPLSGIRRQLEREYRGDVEGFDAAWEALLWAGPAVEPLNTPAEHSIRVKDAVTGKIRLAFASDLVAMKAAA